MALAYAPSYDEVRARVKASFAAFAADRVYPWRTLSRASPWKYSAPFAPC